MMSKNTKNFMHSDLKSQSCFSLFDQSFDHKRSNAKQNKSKSQFFLKASQHHHDLDNVFEEGDDHLNNSRNSQPSSSLKSLNLLGFFRSRSSLNSVNTRKRNQNKKVEIIHNVDGFSNVFSTKETFDLNEISLIKKQYEEFEMLKFNDEIRNDNENCSDNISLSSSSCDYNDEIIKYNSYISHTQTWMTSLKKQTIDYNENTICNIKNIPSRYSNWFGGNSIDEMGVKSYNSNKTNFNCESMDENLTDLVNEFQMNKLECFVNLRKNKDILINSTDKRHCQLIQPILFKWNDNGIEYESDNCSNKSEEIVEANVNKNNNYIDIDSDFVDNILNIFDKFTIPQQSNSIKNNNNLQIENYNINNIFNLNLYQFLNNISLSVGLNTIVFTLDKNFKIILEITPSNDLEVIFKRYFKLLKLIEKNSLLVNNKEKSIKNNKLSLCDYEKKNNKNCDKNLLDYELKNTNHNNSTANSIDDFEFKKNNNLINMKKSLSDFYLNQTNNNEMCDSDTSNLIQKSDDKLVLRRNNNKKNINIINNTLSKSDELEGRSKRSCWLFNTETENIYQPLWHFQTIGQGRESYNSNELTNQNTFYDSSDFSDEVDFNEWEVAEEFSFRTSRSEEFYDCISNDFTIPESSDFIIIEEDEDEIKPNIVEKRNRNIISSPFQRVLIYYNLENPSYNSIIYNCDNSTIPKISVSNNNSSFEDDENIYENVHNNFYTKLSRKVIEENLKENIPNNVNLWRKNLLNIHLMEDEEDVIMTQRSISESSSTQNTKSNQIFGKGPSFKDTSLFSTFTNSKSISTELISGNDSPPEGRFIPNKFGEEMEFTNISNQTSLGSDSTENKSESNSNGLKISENESPKHSPNSPEKKLEKSRAKEKEKERKKERDKVQVFGVELEKVELEPDLKVPKFVVECIKIIEEHENITTNGIYRASGNKNNIESIKKKMNEKRFINKESKYSYLQNQDVHTITGALKLFFRETSDLIPEEIFNNIPKNFTLEENVEIIKTQINFIDEIPLKTLKYLINHLKNVRDNCSENLMTSANLSIIWGASLFTKNVNSIMSLVENDIMNRNVLIKVLIDNYDKIFEDHVEKSQL